MQEMQKESPQAAAAHGPQSGIRSMMRPLEDQENALRRLVNKACLRAAYRLSDPADIQKVQLLVNSHIGKVRKAFTLDDCRRAIAFADALRGGA